MGDQEHCEHVQVVEAVSFFGSLEKLACAALKNAEARLEAASSRRWLEGYTQGVITGRDLERAEHARKEGR